jgi:hypothetical protein
MANPTSRPEDDDDRGGAIWLGAGLLAYGLMVGGIAGLSVASGTSSQLLTSVFTFVGGVLLTYGGFARRSGGLRRSAVGAGLLCFSLGVLGGAYGGIELRFRKAELFAAQGKGGEAQLPWGLQGNEVQKCKTIQEKEDQSYAGEAGCQAAIDDLRWVRKVLTCERQ